MIHIDSPIGLSYVQVSFHDDGAENRQFVHVNQLQTFVI